MKSDRKMTEDILERVTLDRQHKKHQKTVAVKTLGAFFVFALVLVAGFSFIDSSYTPVTGETDTLIEATKNVNTAYSLIVASAAEESVKIYKESSVSIPFGGLLYVKDTKNMSRGEINKIAYDVQCKLKELFGAEDKWSVTGIDGETAVYFGTMNYLKLNIADADAVEEIFLSCGKNGSLMVSDTSLLGNIKEYHKTIKAGKEIDISGEEYKNMYAKNDGMIIKWSPSEELHEAFSNNPQAPLSSVADEISGTIRYVDGSEESFTIKLSFDDSGILSATYNYKD